MEDFQSISLSGTDLEGSDEPAVKRRKLAKQQGEEIIDNFLQKVKQIPVHKLSPSEALAQVNKLKAEVLATENPYIKDVLARRS